MRGKRRSKNSVKEEDRENRNLAEALSFYRERKNRLIGWTKAEMIYLRCTLDEELLDRFGYAWEVRVVEKECTWFLRL